MVRVFQGKDVDTLNKNVEQWIKDVTPKCCSGKTSISAIATTSPDGTILITVTFGYSHGYHQTCWLGDGGF